MLEQIHNRTEEAKSLKNVALITGSARGIGEAMAFAFARNGYIPIVHAREKEKRAREVSAKISQNFDVQTSTPYILGDITSTTGIEHICQSILLDDTLGHLDLLVLNAAGGLENGKSQDYARLINVDAQLNLVRKALELRLISHGGKIIYITSHVAHLFKPGFQMVSDDADINEHLTRYQPIAETKHACEVELAEMTDELARNKIKLNFVSGPLVSRTPPVVYIERILHNLPKFTEAFGLITLDQMANAVVHVAKDDLIRSGAPFIVDPDSFDRTVQTIRYVPETATVQN